MANTRKKTVLITGCSQYGIGAALAERLADQGHTVFATARNPGRIPYELRDHEHVTTLTLDVTDEASIHAAVTAFKAAGHGGLDVLVNNAGHGYTMPLLDVDIDKAKRCHDVAVWGPVRMVQAFSELLIASRGRVVNVGSVMGCLASPWTGTYHQSLPHNSQPVTRPYGVVFVILIQFTGIYSSAKSALQLLSETMRLELQPFGVTVVCLITGTVKTKFHINDVKVNDFVLPPKSLYQSLLGPITRVATGESAPEAMSVEDYVTQILPDVLGNNRGGKVWRGASAGAVWFAVTWLPMYIVVSDTLRC